MASMSPTVLPSPKLCMSPEAVRSPLIRSRSTTRKVFFFATVEPSSSILLSATTMEISMMNISRPLTTDTTTTPSAEASMVIPKERGLFILFYSF